METGENLIIEENRRVIGKKRNIEVFKKNNDDESQTSEDNLSRRKAVVLKKMSEEEVDNTLKRHRHDVMIDLPAYTPEKSEKSSEDN